MAENTKIISGIVMFPAMTSAEWEAKKTAVIPKGVPCFEFAEDNKVLMKVGDGVTAWENLPYVGDGSESASDGSAYKNYDFTNNILKLYRTADKSDTPDEINFPEEQFLDLAKSTIVNPFTWSDEDYPSSDDPNLDGKPVLVLALKNDDGTKYSFLDMHAFISTYDDELSETSENAVKNKVITEELAKKIGVDDNIIINVVI